MSVIAKFSILGLTKGNKYGVISTEGKYLQVCLDNGEIAWRHEKAFYNNN